MKKRSVKNWVEILQIIAKAFIPAKATVTLCRHLQGVTALPLLNPHKLETNLKKCVTRLRCPAETVQIFRRHTWPFNQAAYQTLLDAYRALKRDVILAQLDQFDYDFLHDDVVHYWLSTREPSRVKSYVRINRLKNYIRYTKKKFPNNLLCRYKCRKLTLRALLIFSKNTMMPINNKKIERVACTAAVYPHHIK